MKTAGITLIALVITIIVLLILAGITINLTIGQDGVLKHAQETGMKHKESEIRDKIELALLDYKVETKNNKQEQSIENALNYLLNNNVVNTIDAQTGIASIGYYEITLIKQEDEVIIGNIEQVIGEQRITASLSTNDYTNEDIEIKVNASGNIVKIIKPDNTEEQAVDGNIETSYKVSQNGTYKFIIEDEDGESIEKDVIVDKIDKLAPESFSVTTQQQEQTVEIILENVKDADTDELNACSGIGKYEYFVMKDGEAEYTKYETSKIENLLSEKFALVYVIVYDNAGNKTQSKVIQVSSEGKIYLFKNGEQFSDITGGYTGFAQSAKATSGTITKDGAKVIFESDNMGLYAIKGAYYGQCVVTNNAIDLSKHTTLKIKCAISSGSTASGYKYFKVRYSPKAITAYNGGSYTELYTTKTHSGSIETISLNISSLSSAYYLEFKSGSINSVNIYEIWLE